MNPQRHFSFLVVCILGFYGESAGQKNSLSEAGFADQLVIKQTIQPFKPKFAQRQHLITPATHSIPFFSLQAPVSPSYYASNLGIICKTELKLDKLTPVPLRFRLGSLEYVNWLEQKPNARRF